MGAGIYVKNTPPNSSPKTYRDIPLSEQIASSVPSSQTEIEVFLSEWEISILNKGVNVYNISTLAEILWFALDSESYDFQYLHPKGRPTAQAQAMAAIGTIYLNIADTEVGLFFSGSILPFHPFHTRI